MGHVAQGENPALPQFWFIMSMALIVGFVCAYPINWWLVANHMKHGMLTVRREAQPAPAVATMSMGPASKMSESPGSDRVQPSTAAKATMTVFSFAILGVALVVVQFVL